MRHFFAGLLGLVIAFASAIGAAATETKESAESKLDTASKIAELVRQLDADTFSKRQEASQTLSALGKEAFPALAEAATQDRRETTTRAIEILKKHFDNGDEATKAAAKGALEKIAAGKNASAARAADLALKPKKPAGSQLEGNPVPALRIGGGIQIQAQAQAGNGQRMTMKITNGVKEIEVAEKDRKVKINEGPNQPLKMEVTENKDGKEVTRKYEAKDAEDLKKKHPEAHGLYQKYSRNGVQIQMNIAPAFPKAP